jgi:Skp family chaperone for outer membrane proteins
LGVKARIFWAAALSGWVFVAGAAELKIGFVNTERVFREAAPAKRAQQALEREFSARNAELAKVEKQGRDLQSELERENVTMSEPARREKERQLADISRNFQRLQREIREDLNLRRNEELAEGAGARDARHQPDRRTGQVRPHRAGSGVRELAHRHHREGHPGARPTSERVPCPPRHAEGDRRAPRREAVGEVVEPLTGVATLDSAGPRHIAFLSNPRYRSRLAVDGAGAVILGPGDRDAAAIPRIVTDNPYAYYARTVRSSIRSPSDAGHPSDRVVDPGAQVAPERGESGPSPSSARARASATACASARAA